MIMNNKQGSVLVETAIILPVLFLILLGILEYGRVMYMANALNNAAREGARRAAVSSPTDIKNIETYVKSVTPFNSKNLVVKTEPESPVPGSGASIKVTVTLQSFTALTNMIPVPESLSAQATMRYEYI